MKLAIAVSVLVLAVYACATRRLPPGAPPPEYEPPLVAPWTTEAGGGAAPAGDVPNAPDAGARPAGELSPDAGVR
jgi:hypothetical protein